MKRAHSSALDPSILAIALITAASMFGDSMLYVALPTHFHEVGLGTLTQVGILLSVNRLVRLPLNPLIGWLYRKISPRTGIFIAVILGGLTTMSYAVVRDFGLWILVRSLWGLAWSLLKLGAFMLIIQRSTDSNRGHVMGKYNGLYRLGSLVGMLGGGIFADLFGIQSISWVFGGAAFLAIPAVLRWIPGTHTVPQNSPAPLATPRAWWRHSRVAWALATGLLVSMSLDGLLTATLSHAISVRHPADVRWLWLAVGASTLAGTMQALRWFLGPWLAPWIGKLSDGKWGRVPVYTCTLGLAALLMALVPVHIPFPVWLSLLFVLLLTSTLVTTLSDSIASDVAAVTYRVGMMTTYAIALDVGAALGPTVGYALEGGFGTSSMYWFSTVVLAALTVRWGFAARALKQRTSIDSMRAV